MYKYLIRFEYGTNNHFTVPCEASRDLSEGTFADKNNVVNLIEVALKKVPEKEKKGKEVRDVVLYDEEGNGLWGIEDISIIYRN